MEHGMSTMTVGRSQLRRVELPVRVLRCGLAASGLSFLCRSIRAANRTIGAQKVRRLSARQV